MQFDLIDGRSHIGGFHQGSELVWLKIAYADGPHLAVGEQSLQVFVGGNGASEVSSVGRSHHHLGIRLMQDEQIDDFTPSLRIAASPAR